MRRRNGGRAWLALALLALLPMGTSADDAKRNPLVILVGFAAGGGTDVTARLIAEPMQGALGRPVIVENRPGAGGGVAAIALKHARPDGATLMFAPTAVLVVAPLISDRLEYDPGRDFVPVAQVAKFQLAFAVGPNHSATTLREYVAWARQHRDQANVGTVAVGSLAHLFGREVGRSAGVDMVHVGYKGFPPLAADLMDGRISSGVDALPSLIELHRAGKVRIIATSGSARSPLTPGIATFAEQGFPALVNDSWIGAFAPARTPQAAVETLSKSIATALRSPDVRNNLVARGYEPTGTSSDELKAIMAADTAKWAPIAKASGVSVE